MSFLKDKRIRVLIIVMGILVAVSIVISRYYYQSVNTSFDPRVVPAKELYAKYNYMAVRNDFEGIFFLLDSMESIYQCYPHYKNSYETGVLYNNRAAALLIMAMHKDSLVINSKYFSALSSDTLFHMAQDAVNESIKIYEDWLIDYKGKTGPELKTMLNEAFMVGLEGFSEKETDRFKKSRLKEVQAAQFENLRRLSVSYTNLGIIYRNYNQYELAIEQYKKAIDLWDRNLNAQNNLNILLGRQLKKTNIIQKLFPPMKAE